jgi:hypothetical protein
MNLSESLYQQHCECRVRVERNYVPKRSRYQMFYESGMPGHLIALICVDHNKWIKWLDEAEAQAIEQLITPT